MSLLPNGYTIISKKVFDNFCDPKNKKIIFVCVYNNVIFHKDILVPKVDNKDDDYYLEMATDIFNDLANSNLLVNDIANLKVIPHHHTWIFYLIGTIVAAVGLSVPIVINQLIFAPTITESRPVSTDYFYLQCTSHKGDVYIECDCDDPLDPPYNLPDLHYSFDKKNWEKFDFTKNIISVSSGHIIIPVYCHLVLDEKIYFKGDNPDGFDVIADASPIRFATNPCSKGPSSVNCFKTSFSIGGNIMSLIDSTHFDDLIEIPCDYCFQNLFSVSITSIFDGSQFTDASDLKLPATKLTTGAYYGMFMNCQDIINFPKVLPAITLAPNCYERMFYNCSKLTTSPILPATTLVDSCYAEMFNYCGYLTKLTVGFGSTDIDWPTPTSATTNWLANNDSDGSGVARTFNWQGGTTINTRSSSTIPDDFDYFDDTVWTINHIDNFDEV